ncbi:PREDICTED: uncharacterized protein LOC109168264 [Ipomoea nil]|uniref:uncharacterized protein LOC109168264 n=1 Tax=Ipomoea nil TaxID=35883 RepID=UPI000901676D|nr:PREDICTED: uncharacterized protein LOC109168264 [Ipomoea nil]
MTLRFPTLSTPSKGCFISCPDDGAKRWGLRWSKAAGSTFKGCRSSHLYMGVSLVGVRLADLFVKPLSNLPRVLLSRRMPCLCNCPIWIWGCPIITIQKSWLFATGCCVQRRGTWRRFWLMWVVVWRGGWPWCLWHPGIWLRLVF